jgi:hypothetical protein
MMPWPVVYRWIVCIVAESRVQPQRRSNKVYLLPGFVWCISYVPEAYCPYSPTIYNQRKGHAMSEQTSPDVTHFQWGEVQVAGEGTFKDVKLYPGGARAWDWNETGTQHTPGIQPEDVRELVEQGAEIVILSKGVNERLQTMQTTLDYLNEQGVEVDVLQTERAIERYNDLAGSQPVGALIHSTC